MNQLKEKLPHSIYLIVFFAAFAVWFGLGRAISKGQQIVTQAQPGMPIQKNMNIVELPVTEIQNILILGLAEDSLSNDEGVLLSAWMVTPNFDNQTILLQSVYPDSNGNQTTNELLMVPTDPSFAKLSPTLKNLTANEWDSTIILDRAAFAFLLDQVDNQTASGQGMVIISKLAKPWESPLEAYAQQKDLIRYLFMMITNQEEAKNQAVSIANELADLGRDHIRTDAPLPQLLLQMQIFDQSNLNLMIQHQHQQSVVIP